ncbi:MAG: hypothetical protein H7836_13200 [Magnetococcus sp. YQC-3]
MGLSPFLKNRFAGGDLGPALFMLLFIFALVSLAYVFDEGYRSSVDSAKTYTYYNETTGDEIVVEKPDGSFNFEYALGGLIPFGLMGAAIGALFGRPGIIAASFLVPGFAISGFVGETVVQAASSNDFLAALMAAGNAILDLMTFRSDLFGSVPLLGAFIALLIWVSLGWTVRRLVIG